ncbi:MAG: hypothetical protein IV093_10125 [Rubrivivax sp.]|nr:hypothetical protein [Rubrivivax sp.]
MHFRAWPYKLRGSCVRRRPPCIFCTPQLASFRIPLALLYGEGNLAVPDETLNLTPLTSVRRNIVVIDLVESVKIMGLAEMQVVALWRAFLRQVEAVVDRTADAHLVKSLGDGLLLSCTDTEAATSLAFACHEELALITQDFALPMQLRCGIHVCDVYLDAIDVFGTGVNVAARLAGLSQPGEVTVSVEVRDLLSDCSDFELTDLGLCFVKHIDEPLRAFKLRRTATQTARQTPMLQPAPAGVSGDQHTADTPFDLRPVVAIIPFTVLRSDGASGAQDVAIGDAVADDVIAQLSRSRELRLLSRLSTSAFRRSRDGLLNDLQTRLKARYAVTGRMRPRSAEHFRVEAELVDVTSGEVLWADRFDLSVTALFAGDDLVVPSITRAVARSVADHEARRTRTLPFPNLDGFTLYTGAVTLLHRLSSTDFARAQSLLQHLNDRVPRSAPPLAMLAKWHIMRLVQGWSDNRARDGAAARDSARRALDIDPDDAFSLAIGGLAESIVGLDPSGAQTRYLAAVGANPNEAYAWALLSGTHSHMEQAPQALEAADRALSLSPLDPARFLFEAYRALALLVAGQPEAAESAARNSIAHNAMHAPSHRLLIIALAMRGDVAAAQAAVRVHERLVPGYRVQDFTRHYPGHGLPHAEVHSQALRSAGVPP